MEAKKVENLYVPPPLPSCVKIEIAALFVALHLFFTSLYIRQQLSQFLFSSFERKRIYHTHAHTYTHT
jgi:hypothetical protein